MVYGCAAAVFRVRGECCFMNSVIATIARNLPGYTRNVVSVRHKTHPSGHHPDVPVFE